VVFDGCERFLDRFASFLRGIDGGREEISRGTVEIGPEWSLPFLDRVLVVIIMSTNIPLNDQPQEKRLPEPILCRRDLRTRHAQSYSDHCLQSGNWGQLRGPGL